MCQCMYITERDASLFLFLKVSWCQNSVHVVITPPRSKMSKRRGKNNYYSWFLMVSDDFLKRTKKKDIKISKVQ